MKKIVNLPDKRKLSYIDVGDESGKIILYFHGVPSAADEWSMWGDEEKIKALGIRLIAIDRPGLGLSSFHPNRRISDWAKDITQFVDILGIKKFSVLGYSGGGPYAAACAALIPDRLRSVGIVSSVVSFDKENVLEAINPWNIKFLKSSIDKPLLFRFLYRQVGLIAKLAPKQYLKKALESFEATDAEVFCISKVHNALFSAKGSAKGQQLDTKLIISPWDFDLKDIQIPVYLWQGGKDHNASPSMGRYLEDSITNSIMNYLPEEGHISLIVKNADHILKKLVELD
jgi:pimeloyl-ACP methyl ester carboxylesterase